MVERTITTMSIAARTRTVNFWTFVSRDSKVKRSTPFDGRRWNHIRQVFEVMIISGGDSLRESVFSCGARRSKENRCLVIPGWQADCRFRIWRLSGGHLGLFGGLGKSRFFGGRCGD